MSSCSPSPGRRSFLLGLGAVAIAAGLAGCTMENTLDSSGSLIDGRTRLAPLSAQPAGRASIQMLPFTGIPVTIGDGVYQRFRTQAKEAGIDLVHRLEDPAAYRIQGHFVAVGFESSATIVFTYEIFDASGRRVHRIVGEEVAKLSDGDPWSGVDTDAEMRLATRATRAIKAWLTRAAT